MMQPTWSNLHDFSSLRERRASLFCLIAQLELISIAEESCKNSLSSNLLGSGVFDAANRRISLLDSAIDSLLAVYPSLYGGEPF